MLKKSVPNSTTPDNAVEANGQHTTEPDTSFEPATIEGTAQPEVTQVEKAPDPFDPESLRLSQDHMASIGVKKQLLTVPAKRPENTWFVRVHPDVNYSLQTAVIELKEDRETYLVSPHLWSSLSLEPTFSPRALFTAINRQGVLFLWTVKLPGANGRENPWSQSDLAAAIMAKERWVRVASNMSLGAYECFAAAGNLSEPEWPDVPFRQILATAFKGKMIDSLEHPVLRKLQGEV